MPTAEELAEIERLEGEIARLSKPAGVPPKRKPRSMSVQLTRKKRLKAAKAARKRNR